MIIVTGSKYNFFINVKKIFYKDHLLIDLKEF